MLNYYRLLYAIVLNTTTYLAARNVADQYSIRTALPLARVFPDLTHDACCVIKCDCFISPAVHHFLQSMNS